MKNPLISLIVSSYESSDLLQSRIDNILEQTADVPLELILIANDANSAETEVIERYVDDNAIVKVNHVKRESLYASWNRAIQMASGRYIMPANTDDRLRNSALRIFLDYAEDNSDIVLFYSDLFMTRDRSEVANTITWQEKCPEATWEYIQQPEHSFVRLLRGCYCGPAPIWKRSLHEEYGYFDLRYHLAGDYEFFLRVAERHQFKHIPEALILYLQSPSTLSHRSLQALRAETVLIQQSYMDTL